MSEPLAPQQRKNRLNDIQCPEYIGLEIFSYVLDVDLLDCTDQPIAGITYDDIEPTKMSMCSVDCIEDISAICHVEPQWEQRWAIFPRQIEDSLRIAYSCRYMVSAAERRLHPNASEPTRGACDEPNFVISHFTASFLNTGACA